MWEYSPQIAKIGIFGVNLAKKGIPPYAIFTIFCLEEGAPGPHPHAKFHRYSFKNVALWPQKSPKMAIAPRENFWGR